MDRYPAATFLACLDRYQLRKKTEASENDASVFILFFRFPLVKVFDWIYVLDVLSKSVATVEGI